MNKIIVLLLFSCFLCQAQELADKDIQRLKSWDIPTENLQWEQDMQLQQNLNQILSFDKKRKVNKAWAIGISATAVIGTAIGIRLLAYDQPITDALGSVVIGGSAMAVGLSVPFWLFTNKRKKDRDRAIKQLNDEYLLK